MKLRTLFSAFAALGLVAAAGCSKSSPTRPTPPAAPVDPNDHVMVQLNCGSTSAGWMISTQDTSIFAVHSGGCGTGGEIYINVPFDPTQPLTLTLTGIIADGDSLRCWSIGRSYPAQDSVSHPPDVPYDVTRDIPDAITIHGPGYGCNEFPPYTCGWSGVSAWVSYQGNPVGFWPEELTGGWGGPGNWPSCGTPGPSALTALAAMRSQPTPTRKSSWGRMQSHYR